MRLTLAPVVAAAVAACTAPQPSPTPPPSIGGDRTIVVALEKHDNRCVVRIKDPGLKDARNANVKTAHTVIWWVADNGCGEKTKISRKALGLKSMKRKGTTDPAFWLKDCTDLPRVPAAGGVGFHCAIPPASDPGWQWTGDEQVYEYEIDGDQVEPGDPDLGIKRNG